MKYIVDKFLLSLELFKVIFKLIFLYLNFCNLLSFFIDGGVVFKVVLLKILKFLLSDFELLVLEMDKSIAPFKITYPFIEDFRSLLNYVHNGRHFDLTSTVSLGLLPNFLQHFLFELFWTCGFASLLIQYFLKFRLVYQRSLL